MQDIKPCVEITPTENYDIFGFCFLEKDGRGSGEAHKRTFKKIWKNHEKMLAANSEWRIHGYLLYFLLYFFVYIKLFFKKE